jgi:hypothetical protein
MDEVTAVILGAFIGFLGTILGVLITDYNGNKKELRSFYNWVNINLKRFLELEGDTPEIDPIADGLREKEIHYLFNQMWPRIPEKGKISRNEEIAVRDLIIQFLRSADRLKPIYNLRFSNENQEYVQYRKLKCWLDNHLLPWYKRF